MKRIIILIKLGINCPEENRISPISSRFSVPNGTVIAGMHRSLLKTKGVRTKGRSKMEVISVSSLPMTLPYKYL